jgi:hypothetical protein
METTVIAGVLRIASGEPMRRVRGAVRLEDVTEADAASSVRAEAAVSAEGGDDPVPFRLTVRGPVDPRRRYAVRAELEGEDPRGARRAMGSTQAYPWRPGAPPEPMSIEVRLWG